MFREGEKVYGGWVFVGATWQGFELPVQKTAALLSSRSWEGWEEQGHPAFP